MKGIAYDAEETDMKKVVILVVGNTLSFIGYMIATKRSIETTMTIQFEAGVDIWYKLMWTTFVRNFSKMSADLSTPYAVNKNTEWHHRYPA